MQIDGLDDLALYTSKIWVVWDISILPKYPKVTLSSWDNSYTLVERLGKNQCEAHVYRAMVF